MNVATKTLWTGVQDAGERIDAEDRNDAGGRIDARERHDAGERIDVVEQSDVVERIDAGEQSGIVRAVDVQTRPAVPAAGILEGAERPLVVPPCELTVDDLRALAARLEKVLRQAAERESALFRPTNGAPPERHPYLRHLVRHLMRLRVRVQDDAGRWTCGSPLDVLREEALPEVVEQVVFETGLDAHSTTRGRALNTVVLTLDFRKQPIFDFGGGPQAVRADGYAGFVRGSDRGWVHHVETKLEEFFAERRTLSGWLHTRHTGPVLTVLFAIPMGLLWANHVDRLLIAQRANLTAMLHLGTLIYAVIVPVMAFRLILNYARRIYPRVRGPEIVGRWDFLRVVWAILMLIAWSAPLYLDQLERWVVVPR